MIDVLIVSSVLATSLPSEQIATINKSKAEICLADICYKALVGKDTPIGEFSLTTATTDLGGYGGEIRPFAYQDDKVFAIHRIWAGNPSEKRLERIESEDSSYRIITNGCVNVSDSIYIKLNGYTKLRIVE